MDSKPDFNNMKWRFHFGADSKHPAFAYMVSGREIRVTDQTHLSPPGKEKARTPMIVGDSVDLHSISYHSGNAPKLSGHSHSFETNYEGWTPGCRMDPNDEFYVNRFLVEEDGSISFDDWIDLRQFNNSHNLVEHIKLLNMLAAKVCDRDEVPLSTDKVLAAIPMVEPLELRSIFYRNDSIASGVKGAILVDGERVGIEKHFIKYTFLDGLKERWTIEDLFMFSIQMQKVLYEVEKKMGGDSFLQVDEEVKALLASS